MGSCGVSEQGWRKGPWTPQEDKLLMQYISQNGEGRWSSVSKCTGLNRTGKSCRLRWVNYLRPGLKKGHLTPQEEGIIIELHALWGNKWSTIARYLPGRTDNEIKNYWRTHFKARKPAGMKQEKRKIQRQKQQQEEEETDDSKNNINESPQAADHNEENSKKEAEIVFPSFDNQQFGPTVNQEITVSDFIPLDCYWWDGLWNLDDDYPNGCNKMEVDQNQANNIIVGDHYYPFEGDAVDYVQNGGYIF